VEVVLALSGVCVLAALIQMERRLAALDGRFELERKTVRHYLDRKLGGAPALDLAAPIPEPPDTAPKPFVKTAHMTRMQRATQRSIEEMRKRAGTG
jgi:hypothetical protein